MYRIRFQPSTHIHDYPQRDTRPRRDIHYLSNVPPACCDRASFFNQTRRRLSSFRRGTFRLFEWLANLLRAHARVSITEIYVHTSYSRRPPFAALLNTVPDRICSWRTPPRAWFMYSGGLFRLKAVRTYHYAYIVCPLTLSSSCCISAGWRPCITLCALPDTCIPDKQLCVVAAPRILPI